MHALSTRVEVNIKYVLAPDKYTTQNNAEYYKINNKYTSQTNTEYYKTNRCAVQQRCTNSALSCLPESVREVTASYYRQSVVARCSRLQLVMFI